MKLIGFVSDAHGNPYGLHACLTRLQDRHAGQIYFLGDAVGYFPLAIEVLELLQRYNVASVMGNHDAMLCNRIPLPDSSKEVYGFGQIDEKDRQTICNLIKNWPRNKTLVLNGRKILLVHGSPWDELSGYIYPDSDFSHFRSLNYDVIIMGHTHRPFIKKLGNMLLVNAGSCGLSRDIGNLAACILYDSEKNTAQILRVPFDVQMLLNKSHPVASIHPDVLSCLKRKSNQINSRSS